MSTSLAQVSVAQLSLQWPLHQNAGVAKILPTSLSGDIATLTGRTIRMYTYGQDSEEMTKHAKSTCETSAL